MLTCAWICISLELNLSFIYFNLRLKYRCPKRGQVYADISDYLEKKQRVARSRERKTYFGWIKRYSTADKLKLKKIGLFGVW
jgi:hypothetical protein